MDSVAWGSLVASLIGALAALGGVVITQVFERRKAHDDRIWSQRTEAYVQIMAWCEGWRRWARSYGEGEWADYDSDSVPDPPSPMLDEGVYAQTQAFASARVVNGVRDLSLEAIPFFSAWHQSGEDVFEPDAAGAFRRQAVEIWHKARALRHVLRTEMGVGGSESGS